MSSSFTDDTQQNYRNILENPISLNVILLKIVKAMSRNVLKYGLKSYKNVRVISYPREMRTMIFPYSDVRHKFEKNPQSLQI